MMPPLPARDLTPLELHDLVRDLAADESLWRPLVQHSDDHRHFEQLHRDAHVDVWVLSWVEEQDTGFHDHDVSSGAFHVCDGLIQEDVMRMGAEPRTRILHPGETRIFDPAHIHRVTHAGTGPAVSIHAYSPPLWRLGAYSVEADGSLRRQSVSYAEELRPLASGAAA